MSDINKIYKIDESFKEAKSKLIAEHDQEISDITEKYMEEKKKLDLELKKAKSDKIETQDGKDKEKLGKETVVKLKKQAEKNSTKLQKLIENSIK